MLCFLLINFIEDLEIDGMHFLKKEQVDTYFLDIKVCQ
jgi:hypothetical protein